MIAHRMAIAAAARGYHAIASMGRHARIVNARFSRCTPHATDQPWLFPPSIVTAFSTGTLQAFLKLPLPHYPGKRLRVADALRLECALRAPLDIEQALTATVSSPSPALIAKARWAEGQFEEALRRWRGGHHLTSVNAVFDDTRLAIENLIDPPDIEQLPLVTGWPRRFLSLWNLFGLLDKKTQGVKTPSGALAQFDAWMQRDDRPGLPVEEIRHLINHKDSMRQPLTPAEQTLKKFLQVQLMLRIMAERVELFHAAWNQLKRVHDPVHDGVTLRAINGEPIAITDVIGLRPDVRDWLEDHCREKPAERDVDKIARHIIDEVRAFLLGQIPPAERALLYDSVACQPFTEENMRGPHEAPLIGQNAVVATREIPPWKCIGIYGGFLLPEKSADDLTRSYFFNASIPGVPPEQHYSIDGSNLLCRVNTIFDHDEQGRPVKQADSGYNIGALLLRVRLGENMYGLETACVAAFFNLEDDKTIQPGEELRLDYCYPPEIVRTLTVT
jgi:hypothetical protein